MLISHVNVLYAFSMTIVDDCHEGAGGTRGLKDHNLRFFQQYQFILSYTVNHFYQLSLLIKLLGQFKYFLN